MSVRSISAGQTRRLRHVLLRPDQPWEDTDYAGDTDPLTLHVGSFDGDDLVAVASVYHEAPAGEHDTHAWRLRGMATVPHAGGRGHASAALRAVVGHVARLGGTRLWCNARTPAVGFYARHGFTRVGEEFTIPPIGPHVVMHRRVVADDAALALGPDPAAARIETPRLRLRTWRAGDLDALARINEDPQTMRVVGAGLPLSREETERGLAALVGHWQVHGFGLWAVEERAGGRLIGRAGLWHPPGWSDPELAWLLHRAWWGQGLATEAGRAGLAYGFARRRMDRIIAIVHTANAASRRVADRLGMAAEGETTWREGPVCWYARDRGDWERAART